MPKHYISLALVLCAAILVRILCTSGWLLPRRSSEPLAMRPKDAESTLATGGKILLSCADLYEIELIPGVSDTLGLEILAKRAAIIQRAADLPPAERHRALELVHGIGPKISRKLAPYLDLCARCE
jgi:hypothetical protein